MSDTPDTPPTRRRGDRHWWMTLVRENWYRDLWLLLISATVVLELVRIGGLVDDVQDGRRVGTSVTCAGLTATIDAGRDQISSAARIRPRELELNLMKLGLPKKEARARAADAAADAYARSISQAVAREAGAESARQIVRTDGSLDCDALKAAVGVKSKSAH